MTFDLFRWVLYLSPATFDSFKHISSIVRYADDSKMRAAAKIVPKSDVFAWAPIAASVAGVWFTHWQFSAIVFIARNWSKHMFLLSDSECTFFAVKWQKNFCYSVSCARKPSSDFLRLFWTRSIVKVWIFGVLLKNNYAYGVDLRQ